MSEPAMEVAARQEAERRYPETSPYYANRRLVSPEIGDQRDAFEEGAEWARRETEALVKAALAWGEAEISRVVWEHSPGDKDIIKAAHDYEAMQQTYNSARVALMRALYPFFDELSNVEGGQDAE